ncbi:retinol dehydrogenase 14-like [Uloborus diversus]|uniref:retinol dehydrogenase 14-like n=1 Tax=Uloborus diversus TaxID=327109 RepID=UPI0024098E2E|nr:retinol dehydrogenase 14-like [Uloborus diversus]XP_054724566.1 retinol dehydrogenase 14-like [Uloborus diversus]
MSGKTVLITGASDGIGKATARDIAKRNARVILACRNVGKANKVAEEIKAETGNFNIIVKALDLCSFESVRKCAEDVLSTEDKLHVLINNAGIVGPQTREVTEDGCEKVMQSNHFGHFLLTLLLLDLLKKSAPSRIINVSSVAYAFGKINIDDLNHEKTKYHYMNVYSNSKLANIYFTRELASRLAGTGITVNTLHPGVVKTNIFFSSEGFYSTISKFMVFVLGKTSEEGAQTTIYLAVHPDVQRITGKYFSDCKEEKLQSWVPNRALERLFFESSEKVVGLTMKEASKTIS